MENVSSSGSRAEDEPSITKITPEEAKEKLDNDPSILLVDVRTPDEYK